jgi:hypothetical protein
MYMFKTYSVTITPTDESMSSQDSHSLKFVIKIGENHV